MAPQVFICGSYTGYAERSSMRVYGALWAMSTIAIKWTSGVGYPQVPAGGLGARLRTQTVFPLPGGEGAKGAIPIVSSLILGPLSDGREVSRPLFKGGHW
jgi:hypothetical protein